MHSLPHVEARAHAGCVCVCVYVVCARCVSLHTESVGLLRRRCQIRDSPQAVGYFHKRGYFICDLCRDKDTSEPVNPDT